MKKFIAVITCLTSHYHRLISSELISLGYTVSPASSNLSVDKQAISVIAYCLEVKNKTSADITDDIKNIFEIQKGYFYSCIVYEHIGTSAWHIGNIECETDPTRVLQLKALW